jgi:hypothetical protein
METQITIELKKVVKEVTGVDVTQKSRKREVVEARAVYYKILKEIDKKKSLESIGESVGKNHATVIHSLNNYDIFEGFNPTLKLFKKEILSKLNFKSSLIDCSKDELINNLRIDILNLNEQIDNLQETITKLKEPRNNYNIVTNIEALLLETEGSEQQQIILERLQALYRMNRNIKI